MQIRPSWSSHAQPTRLRAGAGVDSQASPDQVSLGDTPGWEALQQLAGTSSQEVSWYGHTAHVHIDCPKVTLVLEAETVAQAMKDDVAQSSAGRTGLLQLLDGSNLGYTAYQGPQGHGLYRVSLPQERQVEILTHRALEQPEEQVAHTAYAFSVSSQRTMGDPQRMESLERVYLVPELGVGRLGRGFGQVWGQKVKDGEILSLATSASPELPLMLLGGADSEPGWRNAPSRAAASPVCLAIDDPGLKQRWPHNVQVAAGTREGETLPTYATWLEKSLQALPEAGSLPRAFRLLDGQRLWDRDDDNLKKHYHPVMSSNLGPGWEVAEARPRIALLAQGELEPGSPNHQSALEQIHLLKEQLDQHYPGVKILDLGTATPARVEEGFQQLERFAASHPQAESLFFAVAHGGTSPSNPYDPQGAFNGHGEGRLTLAPDPGTLPPPGLKRAYGELSEQQLKSWSQRYLAGFENNLMVYFCCNAGAFVA